MEETARIAVSEFVGCLGMVEVERMRYDWRADDLFVRIELHEPMADPALWRFRRELSRIVQSCIRAGEPLHDWLLVIEHAGQTIARVASHERLGADTGE